MRTSTSSLVSVALALPALTGATICKNFVDSERLQELIKLEDLLAGSRKLQELADAHGGNRAFGSGGHNATVDFVYDTLTALNYYNVTKQPFTELFSYGTGKLIVGGEAVEANIMTYTASGTLVDTPIILAPGLGCTPEEFPATVAGNIALVQRGSCTFAAKAGSAKTAGAAGLIVYNNVPGSLSGTLGGVGNYAPVVGISLEAGQAILADLEAGPVTGSLDINAIVEQRVNYNVIAETKGGDHDNVLVLGGHSDSVGAGPGINDDGSGSIGILRVAEALSKFKVKNAVRFAWWGAEEFGLLGSRYYVNQLNGSATELARMRAYLNFDMIASPNYVNGIYDGDGSAFGLVGPAGSDAIEKEFEKFYDSKGAKHVPSAFSGRSDYAAFIENGVPAGGIFTGAEVLKTEAEAALFGGQAGVAYDKNYHTARDTYDNLNHEAYLTNSKAIAHTVATYALSFDSLAPVNLSKRRYDAARAQFTRRGSHGHAGEHSGPCGGGDTI
ncbi:aminopeptidase Y [Bombardia bombarda]|uniref:Peptide hydrolase n=1 Tax=Bombardia bombarda TaxID=252184 RepID=A0AA40C8B6_9PEZI|nr:aminopeptidase Y [Bombardia bombarda]